MIQKYDPEWFEAALNAMPELVLIKGPDSHLLWANHSFLGYYGMTQNQLKEMIDAPHSDPDDTLQYVKDDLAVVQSGQPLDIPQEAVTDAKGDCRFYHTIKAPIFEDGKVVRIVSVSRLIDNTTIVKRDIDYKDAKTFVAPIRALSTSFPNPMLMVDSRKRVISSSPLWKAYFGDPTLTSDRVFDDVHADLDHISAFLDDCLSQKTTKEGVVHQVGPDGKARVFSARTSPWTYKDGSLGGATIIATDITKFFEQTAELNEANEELMQFSYRASHDLKGPLSTAKGLAKFISMDIKAGDNDVAISNAGKIETLMAQLEKTVLSFLSLARADNLDTPVEAIDLHKTIEGIRAGLRHQIRSSGVRVQTDLRVRDVFAQGARIGQILENLISNGVKYHDPEKTEKLVRVSSGYSADGKVQLTVEDNGCGVPAHATERIFDSFSRFHEDSEGTGLGLAIVKKHVEALRGQVAVHRAGLGTMFVVTLPQSEIPMEKAG